MSKITNTNRSFFENMLKGHNAVESFERLDGDKYQIERKGERPSLTVLLVSVYIMSEGEYYEACQDETIDAIVLIGFYNQYTRGAKETSKENGIALFTPKEFSGALHRTGKSFINYVPKTK